MVGQERGGYVLIEKIGTGGQGDVWLAEKCGAVEFRKRVAIKVVDPRDPDRGRWAERALDEVRIGQYLQHANVVSVLDCLEVEGCLWIVMEHVDGLSLAGLLGRRRREGLPPRLAARVARDVCAGLHYAHEALGPDGASMGLVHRDVKPGNVLISRDGAVKIGDFGIAKARSNVVRTRPGAAAGTPWYMSPEQRSGGVVDRRSDVFAVGAVLAEMLTGEATFAPATASQDVAAAAMAMLMAEGPASPLGRIEALAPPLAPVVARALSPRQEDRYPTAAEMARALEDAEASLPAAPPLGDLLGALLGAPEPRRPAGRPSPPSAGTTPVPPSDGEEWATETVDRDGGAEALRVCPRGRDGARRDLAEAAREAGDGGTLRLAAGRHRLDAALEVTGNLRLEAEAGARPVVVGAPPLLRVGDGGWVRLVGVSFVGAGGGGPVLEFLGTGRSELDGCDVSGGTGAGISVRERAEALVRGGRVDRVGGDGIHAAGTARLAVLGTRCEGNGGAGIRVDEDAEAQVEGATCAGNRGDGVVLAGRAAGTVRGGVAEANTGSGIRTGGEARADVAGVEARSNGVHGVVFEGRASGGAADNVCVRHDSGAGLAVLGEASPHLDANTVRHNRIGEMLDRTARPTRGRPTTREGNLRNLLEG